MEIEQDGAADPVGAALTLMLTQRGCREFSNDPVAYGDLETILEAATHAPSAENRQPWVFVVVRDSAIRASIDELTRKVWAAGAREHSSRTLDARFFEAVDRFFSAGYGRAPVLVVVAGDGRTGVPTSVLASSIYPATQNLLLASAALGYGSSMTTLAAQAPDALAEVIGLPAGVRPFAVIPIGRPARPLAPPRRRPVAEVAHRDRFGEPFSSQTDEPRVPDEH